MIIWATGPETADRAGAVMTILIRFFNWTPSRIYPHLPWSRLAQLMEPDLFINYVIVPKRVAHSCLSLSIIKRIDALTKSLFCPAHAQEMVSK